MTCSRCGSTRPNPSCYVCWDDGESARLKAEREEYLADVERDEAAPPEDRWDYDHGPDHIREVIEEREYRHETKA